MAGATPVSERDIYAQLRSDLRRELNEYRGKPIDYGMLRNALNRSGHRFDWRASLVVGDLLSTHGEFSLAPHVVDFVSGYAAHRRPKRLLDPFVRVPALLAAATDAASAEEAFGYVRGDVMTELATDIEDANVTWFTGDFLRNENPPVAGFDLIVCAPPLGLRFNEITGAGELALLDAAGRVVAPGGEVVFLLSEGFNFDKRAAITRQQLAQFSIHQTATVAIADAARHVAVPLQLVLFRHGAPPPDIFVARLTAQMDVAQVVAAVLERRESSTVELGRTVRADTYRNWGSFAAQAELQRILDESPHPTVPLRDLASTIRRVQLDADDGGFEVPANAIYLTEIRGAPSLVPSAEGARRRSYVEVCLDPEQASAAYLVAWLESPVGRLARETVLTGATIPRLSARMAGEMLVLIPRLEAQLTAIRADSRLAALSVQAAELRAQLWANPGAAVEIEAKLLEDDDRGGLEDWIETLPFPLASIAYRYIADDAVDVKIERLLHLFEATAEFATTLLLSAVRADPEIYEAEREALARPDPDGNPPLERSTFGAWVHVGRRLAKTVRSMLSDSGARDRGLRLFGVRRAVS
jgi:SAM-dependent methyltransferase